MKLNHLVVAPAVLALALAATPTPALAGQHVRHGSARGDAPHAAARAVPRAVAPRVVTPRVVAPRAVPRVVSPYRGYGYRSYGYHPYVGRAYARPYVRPYYYRPYAYTFRPRLSIGLGVFLGYPVPYPYYDPYAYPVTPGPIEVAPGPTGYGGVSLDVNPPDAAVTVDGTLAGTVDDFNDPSHPLSLPIGRHHLEVRAPGYVPLVFDVDIAAGQVTPFQGDLQRD